jgi:methionyl-tRNA synthetase
MSRPFYITTPIYYVNDVPHLGHAYTTTVADAMKQFASLTGRDARLLTGTDEHGLKLERVAQEHGETPASFVDRMSQPFREAWPELGIIPDDFIRTTEARHKAFVQDLWKRIEARGYLYEGSYEDWYCVGCESFKTEKELLPGNLCPLHKKPVERLKEETYFFKLSAFTQPLLDLYKKRPDFVRPESRRNEVVSFVAGGLRDLSVSRTSFRWGIPVPGHDRHVMYVWFDALSNYLSALQGGGLERYWAPTGEVVHLVGKDILRFHAVYWPAFLLAAGYTESQLPEAVVAHGFLTIDGEKMSKALRNAVDPRRLARELGQDVLRYYLLRAISFGQDGDFAHEGLIERYNADLGKNLGNLLQRTLGLCVKLTDGKAPRADAAAFTDLERDLFAKVDAELLRARAAWTALEPHAALEATFAAASAANTYVDRAAPWVAGKAGDAARVAVILSTLLEVLSRLSVALYPALPRKAQEMRAKLSLPPLHAAEGQDHWPAPWGDELRAGPAAGASFPTPTPLFPTYDKEQTEIILEKLRPAPTPSADTALDGKDAAQGSGAQQPPPAPPGPTAADAAPAPAPAAPITYDQFAAVDLRVGLVRTAEKVPKKDKLLKLSVDVGEPEPRQIVAGLALTFTDPAALVGQRVVVVANLAPRDFGKGLVSHGMLLASGPSENLYLATVPADVAPGSKLK